MVANGCGVVMSSKRKRTEGAVTNLGEYHGDEEKGYRNGGKVKKMMKGGAAGGMKSLA